MGKGGGVILPPQSKMKLEEPLVSLPSVLGRRLVSKTGGSDPGSTGASGSFDLGRPSHSCISFLVVLPLFPGSIMLNTNEVNISF